MSLLGGVRIRGLRLGGQPVTLTVEEAEVRVEGLPDAVRSGTRPNGSSEQELARGRS
jgi:hypothetical protein